jgi:hypothetical protein
MAVYRNIQISFWTDAKVADEFTPEDKYFYLYLFTNPHTNLCGCYEISKKQVSWETGYSIDTVDRLIDRFVRIHKVIAFSKDTKELLLLNWHKYNWTSSDKFRKPLLKEIESIKCTEFKDYLIKIYDGDTVSIPYQYGIDTTVTDTVTDTVSVTDTKKSTPKKLRFVPPTVDEVKAYCAERKNNVDAERFIDYYSSQNWKKANGRPLEDWKAAVRTWEKNSYDKPKKSTVTVPVPDYMQKQIEDFEKNYGW